MNEMNAMSDTGPVQAHRGPGAGAAGGEAAARRFAYRLGFWAAALLAALNAVYVAALASIALSGFPTPPPEPAQTIIAVVTLLGAPTLIVLFAGIHHAAPADRRVLSHLSLLFVVCLAVLTAINRYVQLTVVRPALAAGREAEVARFLPYGTGSVMSAIEFLAWGLFFGLAALCAAPVFGGGRLARWIRGLLVATGGLSLLGFGAQGTALFYAAPLAWGLTGPLAFLLMVPYFWRADRAARGAPAARPRPGARAVETRKLPSV
jgi:hypothetical protein